MSKNKYPIGGYVPVNAENELMYRIIENWGNAVAMPQMEGWIKEYGDKRAEEAKPAGAVWVKAADRLPDVVNSKCHSRFVRIERTGHSGKVYVIKAVAYYFPEHFKSVEWEDWDDYSEEDFPYTESDEQRGVVWLRPGWYADIECDACDNSHWSAPLNVIEWLDESGTASNKERLPKEIARDAYELGLLTQAGNTVPTFDEWWGNVDEGGAERDIVR